MGDVYSTLIGLVLGLATGMVTGYYFERRARLEAEAQAADLERQLATLRESVYSVGGGQAAKRAVHADGGLPDEIRSWAVSRQDASGRVRRKHVVSHFMAAGNSRDQIDAAIAALVEAGVLRSDQDWLEVP
ncbi:MAG: hypothetical protein U0P45_05160 [Acidimicrobiales bacterium]